MDRWRTGQLKKRTNLFVEVSVSEAMPGIRVEKTTPLRVPGAGPTTLSPESADDYALGTV